MDGMNKEKWQAMSAAQKREHIWEYYKVPIIAVICVLALAAWFIWYEVNYVDPEFDVIITDLQEQLEDDSAFYDFLNEYDYNVYDGAVLVNQNVRFYLNDSSMAESNGNAYNLLFGLFSLGTQDILISQTQVFAYCATDDAMADLSAILSAEDLEKYKDLFLYVEDPETGVSYPCGINVEGNAWMDALQPGYKGYIGILRNTDDMERAVNFIQYFLKQFDTVEGK